MPASTSPIDPLDVPKSGTSSSAEDGACFAFSPGTSWPLRDPTLELIAVLVVGLPSKSNSRGVSVPEEGTTRLGSRKNSIFLRTYGRCKTLCDPIRTLPIVQRAQYC
jgi:hypothetical protein